MKYKDLIGKKVHINYRKYKSKHEFNGIIEWVEGSWIGLRQEDGSMISLPKLVGRDNMTKET